jgi:hypothetical protein
MPWRWHPKRLDVDGAGAAEPNEEDLVFLRLDDILQASL